MNSRSYKIDIRIQLLSIFSFYQVLSTIGNKLFTPRSIAKGVSSQENIDLPEPTHRAKAMRVQSYQVVRREKVSENA